MKIRLQEIELGVADPMKSKQFYNALGLETTLELEGLKVLKSGVAGVDFNASTHLPASTAVISFLTDQLQTIMDRLAEQGILFKGPEPSHLGMRSIEFKDPDGFLIRMNEPTKESPPWLEV